MSEIEATIKDIQDINEQINKEYAEYKKLANEYENLVRRQAEEGVIIQETSTSIRVNDNHSLNPIISSILQSLKIESIEVISDSIIEVHSATSIPTLKLRYHTIENTVIVVEDLTHGKSAETDLINYLHQTLSQK